MSISSLLTKLGTVAAATESDDPPINKLTIKKTASIMNVSKMNVFEDMSPREKLYATLVDFDSSGLSCYEL